MKLAIYSKGIWDIPNLRSFLDEWELVFRKPADAVAGWGRKENTEKIRKLSSYISLEDGFLRSYDLGVHGAAPFSLVVDRKGIYYDATNPSELEDLIETPISKEELARAEKLMNEIKKRKLTKYNNNIEKWSKPVNKPCVLVVDQCFGDLSIKHGMADYNSFTKMLQAARTENPNHHILIKTHPDVIAGKRRGYIDPFDLKDYTLIEENINPYTIFENVEKVYVVTSMLGFEALIAGVPVRCFGMPFYAGWGATDDDLVCERRKTKHSVAEIFNAAYVKYSRYVSPYDGKRCEIEEVIEILAFLKRAYAKRSSNYTGYGFSRWKRYFVEPYLKTPNNVVNFRKYMRAAIKNAAVNNAVLLVWAAKWKGRPENVQLMEDGFIRSVGLGSDFIAANSLILDKTGIYFDATRPSDIENLLNTGKFNRAILARAKKLRETIIKQSITKYNTDQAEVNFDWPRGKKLILAVGQVENDASIRLGSIEVKTNQELINAIRKDNPEAFIIYKPHPDVVSGNRKGGLNVGGADDMITNVSIHSIIKKVDEVHTITSLAGFEALLHGKKVVTYGMPFYAGWGLTNDKLKNSRRMRKRSLDELVAAALIEYPSYFDFDSGLPCPPEVIIEKILKNKPRIMKRGTWRRIKNGVSGIFKSV